MSPGARSAAISLPVQLPPWLASLLIQVGSFAMVLGFGVVVISLAYGSRSLLVGLGFITIGYLAVGLPGWYLTRRPHHETQLRRLRRRLERLFP